MEADVVVNFINFYTFIDEENEDIDSILKELNDAGIEPEKLDTWLEELMRFINSDKL